MESQGCQTCHSRKIKCDGRRPGCYNCERSRHYICEGYGEMTESHLVGQPSQQRHTSLKASLKSISVDPGIPAGSLSAGQESQDPTRTHCQQLDNVLHDPHNTYFPVAPAGNGILHSQAKDTLWIDPGDIISENTVLSPAYSFQLPDGFWDLQPHLSSPEKLGAWTSQNVASPVFSGAGPLNTTENTPPAQRWQEIYAQGSSSRLPCRYSLPSMIRDLPTTANDLSAINGTLIRHFRTHTCHLMMPTLAPSQNPWLSFYLPTALKEPATPSSKCLLYAIMAVSAFNKAELSSRERTVFRCRGVEYKTIAETLLRSIVESLGLNTTAMNDPVEKQSLLAAALTMTSIEVFSGGSEVKGYENLSIGKRIVHLTGGTSWWIGNPDSMMLLQIFRCLQIIMFTSGWSYPQEEAFDDESHSIGGRYVRSNTPGIQNDATTPENDTATALASLSPGYTLDVSYGISMFTLRCLDKIVGLSKVKQDIQAKGVAWSRENTGDLMKLESEMFNALVSPEVVCDHPASGFLNQNGIPDYVGEEVKNNHLLAFHYSTALFFRRALCDGTATVVPPVASHLGVAASPPTRPTGQTLVSMALEYLENVDAISSGLSNASTLWPGFIAAVEAIDMELRHRALIWFARAQRHGIGNTAKAKALVLEVWRRVDRQTWVNPKREKLSSELGNVDWREVMRETSTYIFLT